MWHKRKKKKKKALGGQNVNHVFIFGCSWLRLSPCGMKWDRASIWGGGEKGLTYPGSHKHPPPPFSPKPFSDFTLFTTSPVPRPRASMKKRKKKKNAYSYSSTFLNNVIITEKTKSANGRVRVLNIMTKEKQPCFFFSHVCSCSVLFFFFNVSKWEEKDYCNKTVILI